MAFLREGNRVRISFVITSIALIVGVLLSWKLWGTDRFFPFLPVSDLIPRTSNFLSLLLILILIGGLLIASVFPRKLLSIPLFLLFLFILSQDQMRWQPWVYLYFFLLLPLLFYKRNQAGEFLSYLQILIIGVYLWSGLYKFSGDFNSITFERMLFYLFRIDDEATRISFNAFGYLIPVFEVLIAIALFFKKTRFYGIIGAIISHFTILIYLFLSGHNTVVYPWNIAMIILVIILFYKSDNKIEVLKLKSMKARVITAIGVLLFLILPATSSFGLWDRYPSFKLYSGTNGIYMVAIDKNQITKIDYRLHDYFYNVKRFPTKYCIYVNLWAIKELNVPFYPEERTFKALGKTFCEEEIPESKIDFYILWEDFETGDYEKFSCSDLK